MIELVRLADGVHALETTLRVLPGFHLPLRSTLLSAAQWALACGVLLVAVHGMGSAWALWAARGLTVLATFFALWRVAVAVEHSRDR